MPVITDFPLPSSATALQLSAENPVTFLSFHASPDPNTGKPWCPDVVAALPHLQEVFSTPQAPQVAFINVGQKDEWKDLSNVYRTKWNVGAIPTLVRYELVDGDVKETGRLVEAQILDRARLSKFVSDRSASI
ncbi:hypothetical protein ASPSYDRAFT_60209 [Aspergillus sydowii CBS 593.65]|uniref:Thioredoxin domain-containing protein n=1 Tax=Aspergillus sydowii CBS 593.65 TaxID=1036612 RepID=A0A1L9T9L5_9EURO|nr:uncharacterized protein ASPSYDRAFT_60209 [Aspergillus sydowii CBS 593.65]OJJ56106.1 hypothetical protein ASPSYDRAFT_60209 [Aspergillus sydowii CBS 593.65]